MAWATTSDVLALTGQTVDSATLAQAQGVVELFAGVTATNTELSDKALRTLKTAVIYQAAWLLSQVDITSRMEVTSLEQDGSKVTPGSGDDLLLAPLAKRALARLPWASRGSIRVSAPCAPVYASMEAWQAAWLRDDAPDVWRAL